MRMLTFTHNPKDFKFIHYITDVRDLHEVKRYVAWGAWSSGAGGPATGRHEAASCWLPTAVCQLWAIISDTCLLQGLVSTCTKTYQITYIQYIAHLSFKSASGKRIKGEICCEMESQCVSLIIFARTFLKRAQERDFFLKLFLSSWPVVLQWHKIVTALSPGVKGALQWFSIALPFS